MFLKINLTKGSQFFQTHLNLGSGIVNALAKYVNLESSSTLGLIRSDKKLILSSLNLH